MKKTTAQLDGQTLKLIIIQFSDAWAQKVKDQGDVLTFHDGTIQQALTLFLQNMDAIPWNNKIDDIVSALQHFTQREQVEAFISLVISWHFGRFVDYDTRTKPSTHGRNLDFLGKSERDKTFSMSQGRFDCLKWKDTILFKTVFDLGIYQMLMWELKPKTVIEIGSGTGGSAVWMSDLMTAYNLDCKIISVDIYRPSIQYKNVTFLKGDCYQIEAALDAQMLSLLPHPWLVIEDAHANVSGVLNYLHQFLQQGDYLILEDSVPKQDDIAAFLADKKGSYMLDTQYCDFFGRNLTCSWDSIFRRM
jgi:cephalosporin hydroxylase